ncbi:MAG TPA: hypothetical protein VFT78_10860 [Hanamia sp.]|nr:hypothetical protein [Hanamia sp.]
MQFEKKIVAQQEVKNKLKELVQQNRLSHALLFLGKEGCGALPLAIAFAQYILCERVAGKSLGNTGPSLFAQEAKPTPTVLDDSCGECPTCLKVSKLVHADLHFSYPALKRNARHDKVLSTDYLTDWREFVQQFPYGNVTDWIDFLKESQNAKIETAVNKQGNISAQECDDITRKLSLKAFESEYKIMIMWMPEYLGKEGNKLLKLIEEPPPNTIFIFVAEDENSILQTILSRTQLVKIPTLTDAEIKNALVDLHNVESEKAIQIAALAEGNYREALQLLNNPEEDLQAQVRDWLNIIIKNKVSAQLSWVEEISRTGREKQKSFLRYFVHLLEQSIRSAFLPEEVLEKISAKDRDFSARLNRICSVEAQQSIVEELEKAIYYIERNAHAKMLFHSLTIRFFHIIKDNSLILVN